MSMNIKSEEAHRLARAVAAATGESLTEAVTVALRERLDHLRMMDSSRGSLAERILAVGKDCAKHMREPFLSTDHGELLYDELGLPK